MCILHFHASQFRLATFPVLSRPTWLLATTLDSRGLDCARWELMMLEIPLRLSHRVMTRTQLPFKQRFKLQNTLSYSSKYWYNLLLAPFYRIENWGSENWLVQGCIFLVNDGLQVLHCCCCFFTTIDEVRIHQAKRPLCAWGKEHLEKVREVRMQR